MANRSEIPFVLFVHTDGTSTTLTSNTTTGPFLYGNSQSYNFAGAAGSLVPIGTGNLNSSDGTGITATIGVLGAITFTWASAPAAQDLVVSGYLVF